MMSSRTFLRPNFWTLAGQITNSFFLERTDQDWIKDIYLWLDSLAKLRNLRTHFSTCLMGFNIKSSIFSITDRSSGFSPLKHLKMLYQARSLEWVPVVTLGNFRKCVLNYLSSPKKCNVEWVIPWTPMTDKRFGWSRQRIMKECGTISSRSFWCKCICFKM